MWKDERITGYERTTDYERMTWWKGGKMTADERMKGLQEDMMQGQLRQDKCRKKGNVRKEDWMNDSCSTRLRYSRVKRENILIFSIWHSAWKHQQSNYKRFIYNLKYSFYCVQTVPHHIKFVKALATKYENIFIYYLQIWRRIPT